LCAISGIEILFARAEGIDAVLNRSGFKEKFGQKRFFNRRVEALRYAWKQIDGMVEDAETSPKVS